MATVQATQETAAAVMDLATSILELSKDLPFGVGDLCTAVLSAKNMVDQASDNQKKLGELCERCRRITIQVIEKLQVTTPLDGSPSPDIDVSDLLGRVNEIQDMAGRQKTKCCLTRCFQSLKDGKDIQELERNVNTAIVDLTAAGVVDVRSIMQQQLRDMLAYLQQLRPPLAKVPRGVPIGQSWHVVRATVEDEVYQILRGDEPAVVALTGRSGAGKSTAAAAMVGERQGPTRRRDGETEDEARTRLDRVRVQFSHGVVWLPVGQGASDRLPDLMLTLAKNFREYVMDRSVDLPEAGEDGASYVKNIVEQKSKRCLVVADDVWEKEVVDKLRKTGLWVLLTTRHRSMVENSVSLDELTQAEAEGVLRGAAMLPSGHGLCDAAMEVIKICDHAAMDIAFVGSWSSVRTTNGVIKSREAWERAVGEIKGKGGGVGGKRDVNRLAVLRAGFEFLAREDPLAQKLYVALAVFPNGFWFSESIANVLLDDKEAVMDMISILERWGVLKADASAKYRMHDAHVAFASEELNNMGRIRKQAVDRWTTHISRLDFAMGVDVYELLRLWRALQRVGGDGWFTSRPYDKELVKMDPSNPSTILAVLVVAELYCHDDKFGELEQIMRGVLDRCDVYGGDCHEVRMITLYYTRNALCWPGRSSEREDIERQLGEFSGLESQLRLTDDGVGFLQVSTTLSMYGICARAAGRLEDAKDWFRKSLKVQQDGGLATSYQTVFALSEIGQCSQEAGRPDEADEWFEKALKVVEVKLGPDDPLVACLLQDLGRCVREAGRLGEAEGLFQRALEIKEAKLGRDDPLVANVLHELGWCVREAGRLREAEALFQRALEIKKATSGPDSVAVAVTLQELGVCARGAGRLVEAEALLKQALKIKKAKSGPDSVRVAVTLQKLGGCVREAGRLVEAEALLKQALEIQEAKSGPKSMVFACVLHELGQCALEARRLGEAEGLLQRALGIFETKKGRDNFQRAATLHVLGACAREAGRLVEAEGLLQRALGIFETKKGRDYVQRAATLHELGACAREAGRLVEAEACFQREREIRKAMKVTNVALYS